VLSHSIPFIAHMFNIVVNTLLTRLENSNAPLYFLFIFCEEEACYSIILLPYCWSILIRKYELIGSHKRSEVLLYYSTMALIIHALIIPINESSAI
jgi:hypothetical protein